MSCHAQLICNYHRQPQTEHYSIARVTMAAAGVKGCLSNRYEHTHTPESEPVSLRLQAHLTGSPPAFDSRQRMTSTVQVTRETGFGRTHWRKSDR